MAYRTFERKKDDPVFFSITKKIMEKLKLIKSPTERASFCHKEVDDSLTLLMKEPLVSDSVSCKKGCAYCCHTQVSVTEDETQLLIEKGIHHLVKKENIQLLKLQKNAANSGEKWLQLPYGLRKCLFLGDDNSCQIYNHRPLVCRTNLVIGNPNQCSTVDGSEKPLRSLNTFKADMITMGAFLHSKENGAMPYMLYKVLNGTNKTIAQRRENLLQP